MMRQLLVFALSRVKQLRITEADDGNTALPLLKVNGTAISDEDREALQEWTEGSEQQDDLRRWADALEAE